MTGGLPVFFSDRENITRKAGGKRPGEIDSLQILGGRTKQNQFEEIWSNYIATENMTKKNQMVVKSKGNRTLISEDVA